MSIADWFTARETKRYTKVTEPPGPGSSDVPDGVWVKCDGCKRIIYEGELVETMRVCKTCGFHFDLTAPERIEMLADEGSFVEIDADVDAVRPARVRRRQGLRRPARVGRREERSQRGAHHRPGAHRRPSGRARA